jgi:hypothetical protein
MKRSISFGLRLNKNQKWKKEARKEGRMREIWQMGTEQAEA